MIFIWVYFRETAQVAEWGEGGEIVGVIRGCIKRVKIRGNNTHPSSSSDYVKAANVLGLRVSPSHRFSPSPSPSSSTIMMMVGLGGMHVCCFVAALNMRLVSYLTMCSPKAFASLSLESRLESITVRDADAKGLSMRLWVLWFSCLAACSSSFDIFIKERF